MPAEPLLVDPLASYARRTDGAVEIVLHLPEARFKRHDLLLRLHGDDGGLGVAATAEPSGDPGGDDAGRVVRCTVPRGTGEGQLRDGTWRLKLRVRPETPLRPLRTRLVVTADGPAALLPPFSDGMLGI